ncbi:unnamed protein product [Calicophoron daubneyi]|uniref:Innexin n=1 Tax=Calicophoron daubneyi TaxID=300641 RepID=A0AAV2TBT2_CALDB
MEVACEIEMIKDPETRKTNITYVARHIEDALDSQREYRSGCAVRCRHCLAKSCCLWFGKRYGNYLTCLYLITKSLYIINVVGQFFFMNRILGTNYTFYGLDLLRDLAEGFVWQESGNFPRITLCDFEVRKLANTHRHTVQCVLPINMFNEKIFIFLWFWFVLVAAVNTSSFLYWSYKSSFHGPRVHFIRKFLKLRDALEPGDKKRTFAFVDSFLRQDGVFIVRLIAQNAGELVASEVVEKLWVLYKTRQNVSTVRLGATSPLADVGKSGAISPRSFMPQQYRPNHQHHSRHHQQPSPMPAVRQRSSRSLEPTSPTVRAKLRNQLPPSYSSRQPPISPLEPPGLSPLPPPLPPPAVRSSAPPPLPPPPGGSIASSTDRTSSSTNSRSALSTIGGNNENSTGMQSAYLKSSTTQVLKPVSSRTVAEKKTDMKGYPLSGSEGSSGTQPVGGSQTNNTAMRTSQIEDDPGEFV